MTKPQLPTISPPHLKPLNNMSLNATPTVRTTLHQLATALDISENALITALTGAFDLAQQNGNPSLSLHIVLGRMGYGDTRRVYCAVRTLREGG